MTEQHARPTSLPFRAEHDPHVPLTRPAEEPAGSRWDEYYDALVRLVELRKEADGVRVHLAGVKASDSIEAVAALLSRQLALEVLLSVAEAEHDSAARSCRSAERMRKAAADLPVSMRSAERLREDRYARAQLMAKAEIARLDTQLSARDGVAHAYLQLERVAAERLFAYAEMEREGRPRSEIDRERDLDTVRLLAAQSAFIRAHAGHFDTMQATQKDAERLRILRGGGLADVPEVAMAAGLEDMVRAAMGPDGSITAAGLSVEVKADG